MEVLKSKERPEMVVAIRYAIGKDLVELQGVAERERTKHHALGYRLHDLHTDEVKEVWD
jgi:hypothetical protein